MKKEEQWELYLYRFTTQQALDFIAKTSDFLGNCVWHMRAPYSEPSTQNIYCEIDGGDFDAARTKLGTIAAAMNIPEDRYDLKPTRV